MFHPKMCHLTLLKPPRGYKFERIFSRYPKQHEAMEAPPPAQAPAQEPMVEKEEWECHICNGNGKTTGKVTLACNHETCLACFVKITNTPNVYGQLPTEPKCPFCRGAIRTTEGLTEQDRTKVRIALTAMAHAEGAIESARRRLDTAKGELTTLLQSLNITEEEAREAIRTAQENRLYNSLPVRPDVDTQVPQRDRCPGCREQRPVDQIQFRHLYDPNGGVRRLRRCIQCQNTARETYERIRERENARVVASLHASGEA
jgi:hypothetical protein